VETTVDGRRTRHWVRWLAVGVVVVAVGVAVLLRVASGASSPAEPTLSEQLSSRVVEILEESSSAEHEQHGHHFGEACEPNEEPCEQEATGVLCAASAFGFDPPDAATLDQVRVVYAHHMCAVVGPAFGWPDAVRSGGPLTVELTEPPTVRTPELVPAQEGMDYAGRIRALIPERYHEQALIPESFVDPAVADALRERYQDAS
jgi:hypothetical protein